MSLFVRLEWNLGHLGFVLLQQTLTSAMSFLPRDIPCMSSTLTLPQERRILENIYGVLTTLIKLFQCTVTLPATLC